MRMSPTGSMLGCFVPRFWHCLAVFWEMLPCWKYIMGAGCDVSKSYVLPRPPSVPCVWFKMRGLGFSQAAMLPWPWILTLRNHKPHRPFRL